MKLRRILDRKTCLLAICLFVAGCDSQEQSSQQAPDPASMNDSTESAIADSTQYPQAGKGTTAGDWDAYGADIGSTKYTPLDQIDANNIDDLEIVWRRPALDEYYVNINPQQRYSNTWTAAPIVKNGVAYVTNGVGLVEAFDPGTGETIWVQEPPGGS